MSERRAKGCLVAALIWCVILVLLGGAYRFLIHPHLQQKLAGETGGASQYKDELVLAADSFSGYAVLRSEPLKQQLKSAGIRLTVQDDRGDVNARLKALQDGRFQFAAFTVDSLLTAGARLKDFPATIVLVLDESKGADAIVAHKSAVASLQDLNHPDARIVLTPNSPSEFLARVVIAHFNLPNLPSNWLVPADGPQAAFAQLRATRPAERKAFVLWEPYVSRALAQPGFQVLLDSSKLKGYVVDVLVAQRQFLKEHPDKVRAVIEAYSRAAYAIGQQPDGFLQLVRDDASRSGAESLDADQARKVVAGIAWKNTLENYAHFGLLTGAAAGGVSHLEDVIGNIVEVLLKTRALETDPLDGKYHTLFYPQILAELKAANFHPAKGLNLIQGVAPSTSDLDPIRADPTAGALTPEQWAALRPVGELRVEPIVFTRGSANLSVQSERDLAALARRLQSFPNFYLRVLGHTRAEGDPEANRALAQARAEAAAAALRAQGLRAERLRTEAVPAVAGTGDAQAVTFVVGQVPY